MRNDPSVLDTRLLSLPLFARAAASGVLSAYLLQHHLSLSGIFRATAWYAVVDGVFGLVGSALLLSLRFGQAFPLLTSITLVDAVIRVVLGFILLDLPTVAEVPIRLVPLFGVVGVTAAALGVAALIVWLAAHHRFRRVHRRALAALYDPLSTIGLLSVAVGSLLFFSPPSTPSELRDVIATAGVILAGSFAVSGIGAFANASLPLGEEAAPPSPTR